MLKKYALRSFIILILLVFFLPFAVKSALHLHAHPVPTVPILLSSAELAPHALARAKQEVLKVLWTPSVASFPDIPRVDQLWIPDDMREPDEHAWFIMGDVDSQNLFGAMIRNIWFVRISYHCSLSHEMLNRDACWKLDHLQMWNPRNTNKH